MFGRSEIRNQKSEIRRPLLLLLGGIVLLAPSVWAREQSEPTVMHGAGQVVKGVVVELPKTVIEATLEGPVVVGTLVGMFAGTIRALQVTTAGLVEMTAGFHPFEERR